MCTVYKPRASAAEHLTQRAGRRISAQALADMAHDGTGPTYAIVRGRAVYRVEDLDAWLDAEFARGMRQVAA